MSTWQIYLESLILQRVPRRLLVRDATLLAWLDDVLNPAQPVERVAELPADLALLSLPGQTMAEIARLRDHCPRLIVLTHSPDRPDFSEFLALGFERLYQSPEGTVQLYSYDIATYKSVPDWLNAKYWAHPERWEP
ncbi:MAG: DUF6231 family protein [Thiobacillaceae bacterium]|jgi:hypothetical protein